MNLLSTILQNPAILSQLSQQFSLSGQQTESILQQMIPVLARGLQNNTSQSSGLDALSSALSKGSHSQYFDNPSATSRPASTQEGNGILGHLLGSKDVSRTLAKHTGEQTGVSSSLIKKMLPIVATLVMGALSKQSAQATQMAPSGNSSQGGGDLGSLLGGFLDMDNDGSVADDLLNLAGKFLMR